MIYYIVPILIWSTFCTWKALRTAGQLEMRDYVFALPLILLAVLRGDVGTDTLSNLINAQDVIQWGGQSSTPDEFGYVFLMRFLATFISDPRLIVAVISLLAAILFFVMLHLWESGKCVYSLVFVPLFFFSLTMNTLRVGIAFPLAVISVLLLEKKQYVKFSICALAAVTIQMTAVILLPLLLLARRGARSPSKWITYRSMSRVLYALIVGLPIVYIGYNVFKERIVSKLLLYYFESLYSHEGMSGIFPLVMSVVCCLVAIQFCEKTHRYLGVIFVLIQVVFYRITLISYAGLRFQAMALFAQVLALSYWARRPIRGIQLAIVLLLCGLALSGTIRNFADSDSEPYAFTPYQFVWESR
jgi:hypothetical protein